MIALEDVRQAAARIEGRVRRTPLLAAAPMQRGIARLDLVLKLECLQVTGSFKARGAISKLGTLAAAEVGRGIVTASGGNHGAAVAYAGWVAGTPTTVFVPANVSPAEGEQDRAASAPASRSRAASGTRATGQRSPAPSATV